MEQKQVHVICNTHWDREWVYPFEETRLLLIEFMDHLLDLLDAQPDYHSFLMDAQTLCVEDYLELRPEARPRVEKHVLSGRLIVGPWYSLPEEYIVNGESLVRNLVVGHRVAESLGRVMKLGYTPFSYGQTSQMPQIYHGFDIDTIIFYRGINTPKSEFVMEGPDGSRLLGMRFGALSRFSFYFYIYRLVVYNKTRDDWRYEWQRGALPFRLCSEQHPVAHYYVVDPAAKCDRRDYIPEQVNKLVRDEAEHFTTRHIASMQGFDSSDPDPLEAELIREADKYAKDAHVFQSSLEAYMAAMREEVKDPYVIRGESRDPGATGKWTHLFGDVISSRTRTKRLNARAETALQRLAEPFGALAWTLGAEYLKTAFDYAWRLLLKSHPHDTICAAGVDQMEKDMVNRLEQVQIISEGLMRRGMQQFQRRIDNSDLDPKEAVITVFNPSPFPRAEVVTALVDLPEGSGYDAFSLRDPEGQVARKQEVSRFPWGTLVRNLQDISLELPATRVKLHFEAADIPALGYKTYRVKHEERETGSPESLVAGHNTAENEHLRLTVNGDGTLALTEKRTGHTFAGLHYLEDVGETGHSWVHMSPEHDEVLTSHGVPVDIALEESGPLYARFRADYHMQIPDGLEQKQDGVHRAQSRKLMTVTSLLTVRKGRPWVEVVTRFDNPCKFHRLRAVFPTHLTGATHSEAEAAFDVIRRVIDRTPESLYYERPNPQYPMHRFVEVSDGRVGLAILNDGMREYEVLDVPERPLAITLMRGFEFRQSPVIDRWDVHPEMLLSQSLGEHEFRYAIFPHAGRWEAANVPREADAFTLPLEAAQAGKHGGDLPRTLSLLRVEPETLALSALKRAEERQSVIVRLYNPAEEQVAARITTYRPIKEAYSCNMNEDRREALAPSGNSLALTAGKKKILTVELVF